MFQSPKEKISTQNLEMENLNQLSSTNPETLESSNQYSETTLVQNLEHAATILKEKYKSLYQRILTIDSSCFGIKSDGSDALPMEDLLNRIVEDTTLALPCDYLDLIDKKNFDGGFLFHDLSGIGLYALAYQLANAWAENKIFAAYKAVVVLPIEQMHRLILSGHNYSLKLNDIFKAWGINIAENLNCNDVLVIVSGYSEKLRSSKNQGKISSEQWLEFIQNTFRHHIIISNMSLSLYKGKTLNLSLKPFHLRVDHLRGKPENKVVDSSTCYISGKLIVEEAQAAIEQTFFEPTGGKAEGSIWTTQEWHNQIKKIMQNGGKIEESEIKLKHKYKPFTTQKFIAALMADKVDATDTPEPLQNPAQWFAAATTYTNEDYASYCIANYFISRKANNYIDNLGSIEDISTRVRDKHFIDTRKSQDTDTELMIILKDLWKKEEFRLCKNDSLLLKSIKKRKWEMYKKNFEEEKLKIYNRGVRVLTDPNEEINRVFFVARTQNAPCYVTQ